MTGPPRQDVDHPWGFFSLRARPMTVEVGANVLAGTEPEKIVGCARNMIERERTWENPFGDGRGEDQTDNGNGRGCVMNGNFCWLEITRMPICYRI